MLINKNEAFDVMDSGLLNSSIKGYLAETMRLCGYNGIRIAEALQNLCYILDMTSAEEAERYFIDGKWGE